MDVCLEILVLDGIIFNLFILSCIFLVLLLVVVGLLDAYF
jgi:hypothetical protein